LELDSFSLRVILLSLTEPPVTRIRHSGPTTYSIGEPPILSYVATVWSGLRVGSSLSRFIILRA